MKVGSKRQLRIPPSLAYGVRAWVEIVSSAQERRFARRQTIFRQGDPAEFVFVLISGRVKITESTREGIEVILSNARSGRGRRRTWANTGKSPTLALPRR